jgi:hypothetical protein
MRRSTVLSLPLQLVFHGGALNIGLAFKKSASKSLKFDGIDDSQ